MASKLKKAQGCGRRGVDVTPVKVPAPAGSVHDWGETLEQGTKPPTAPRALPVGCPLLHLDGLNAENTFHSSLYSVYCVCDK